MELLKVEGLRKHFEARRIFGSAALVKAVDGVDFAIGKDRVFALVGESGCGKSTVARLVLRLIDPTAGGVFFRGEDVFRLDRKALKSFRRSVQIIFQDPFASLNPRRTVYDTLSEPFVIHGLVPRSGLRDGVAELLSKVGLNADMMSRYPHEFSGGQRQRICIARALSVSPELIVADEPLSALDVSIQAQILNLLQDLKKETGISFLFISHDLRVVRYFSDEVGVMYLGKIVEQAGTDGFFERPLHPYSEILLASVPKVPMGEKSGVRSQEIGEKGTRKGGENSLPLTPHASRGIVAGDVPSPADVPPGCPFHPRCPKRFEPCDRVVPGLKAHHGRLVSCHLWNPW